MIEKQKVVGSFWGILRWFHISTQPKQQLNKTQQLCIFLSLTSTDSDECTFVDSVPSCTSLSHNSYFSIYAQKLGCIRSATAGGGEEVRGSGPKAMGIINVYCSFMSLSLSACFHPLGIVCVREHYSLFNVCLTHAPTRAHTHTHTE